MNNAGLTISRDESARRSLSTRMKMVLGMAAVAAALFVGIGGAAPAHADPTGYCIAGRACVWDDPEYKTQGSEGRLLWFEFSVTPMSAYNYISSTITAGDTADSWYNNGNVSTACFYDLADYSGSRQCLTKKTGDGNIANTSGYIQNINWDPNSAKFI